MPLVLITRSPGVGDQILKSLLDEIREIVAEGLSVPGTKGELTDRDIEVKVQEKGHLDQNIRDVAIVIWANEYPERRKNLDERRKSIAGKIKKLLPSVNLLSAGDYHSGSLWILLQPGSYEEW